MGWVGILTLFARRHYSRSDYSDGLAPLLVCNDQEAVLHRAAVNHETFVGEAGVCFVQGERIVEDRLRLLDRDAVLLNVPQRLTLVPLESTTIT
jgi:hypothetical protein